MLQNAKCQLVSDLNRRLMEHYRHDSSSVRGTRVECDVQCKLQSSFPDGVSDKENDNLFETLDTRLAELLKVPRNEWLLSLDFTIEKSGVHDFDTPLHVTVRGKILEQLQTLMSYSVNDSKLKLLLTADLRIIEDGQVIGINNAPDLGTVHYHTELFPQMGSDDLFDHSIYRNSNGPKTILNNVESVDSFQVWIEGIEKKPTNTNSNSFVHFLREHGFGSDVSIHYKVDSDDEEEYSPIRVHGNILIAQSPVIQTMLEKNKFAEGSSRVIVMPRWTREEVTAFIHYMYFRDLEMAWNNATLAVTLYEMGNYYGVKSLEKAIKTVLLSMRAEPSKQDDCIRLLKVANASDDWGLKQLAVEMLKMRTLT